MNLNPGGKQPIMRPSFFNGHPQSMVFPLDHPDKTLRGQPKGLKKVLEERSLWPKEGLRACCMEGKKKQKKKICKPNATNCCAEKVMSLQPDFLSQKSLIAEVVEAAGHKCIFYPKFHPELNYIEYFWAEVKRFTREKCDYSWAGLKRTLPIALASVDVVKIRKLARRAKRYMDSYRKNLSYQEAEYAEKKYRSHRRTRKNIQS
jgi:transposase